MGRRGIVIIEAKVVNERHDCGPECDARCNYGADLAKAYLEKRSSFPELPSCYWQTFFELSKNAVAVSKDAAASLQVKKQVVKEEDVPKPVVNVSSAASSGTACVEASLCVYMDIGLEP